MQSIHQNVRQASKQHFYIYLTVTVSRKIVGCSALLSTAIRNQTQLYGREVFSYGDEQLQSAILTMSADLVTGLHIDDKGVGLLESILFHGDHE
jgi:hypothetical protein